MSKREAKIERRAMPVNGGEAWVEITRYPKRRPHRISYLQTRPDGTLHRVREVVFMKGMTTGDCPECKQMPCGHTATLLNWTTELQVMLP